MWLLAVLEEPDQLGLLLLGQGQLEHRVQLVQLLGSLVKLYKKT